MAAAATAALAKEITSATRPTKIPAGDKFATPPPKGKTVAFVTCGATPVCQAYVKFLQQGTAALGWKLKTYESGPTPQAITNAMNQIVRDKPDGVIATTLPKALIASQLKSLATAGIPFVNLFDYSTPGDGQTASINGSAKFLSGEGATVAYWTLSHGGKPGLLWVSTKDFPVLGVVEKGLADAYKAACPACAYETLNVASADIGGPAVAPRIVSFLRAHSDIKFVGVAFADMSPGLPAALSAAGLGDISLVTTSTNTESLNGIKNGNSAWKAGIIAPLDGTMMGLDLLARSFAKLPLPSEPTYPGYLATKETVPQSSDFPPIVTNVLDQYKALWGVS